MHNWLCCKVPHIINNIRDFIKTVKSFIKSLLFFIKPIIKNPYSFIKDCRRFIKNMVTIQSKLENPTDFLAVASRQMNL